MARDPLPVGDPVEPMACGCPRRAVLTGKFVSLAPLDAAADAAGLFAESHGNDEIESLWTYMLDGPFAAEEEMRRWLQEKERSADPLFFTVHESQRDRPIGMVSFLNIVPEMRRLEVGNIWYGSASQRTKANTEAALLMLRHAFEDLGYRRVEWKCDALNGRSRAAALRLGFAFEGIFRNHMIVKGHNRDTAWYAMTDADWPSARKNMTIWLYENPDGRISLARLNTGSSTAGPSA